MFKRRLIGWELALLFTGIAAASPITVTNYSFETLSPAAILHSCGFGCTFTASDPIPGWTATGTATYGQNIFFPPPNGWFNVQSDGPTAAYLDYASGSSLSQVVGTVTAGTTYTLSVDVGLEAPRSMTPLGIVNLVIGNTVYTASGPAPAAGYWSTFTATYVAQPGDVGAAIAIYLVAPPSNLESSFDNVRLDAASGVPEPGTMTLFIAVLALAGPMRLRRLFLERRRRLTVHPWT